MKLNELLKSSMLDEAKKKDDRAVAAFGVGYFVDPDGNLYSTGFGKTHEQWAEENRDCSVSDLIRRGWTRIRDFGPGMDRIVQGDALNYSNIWYLVDVAENSNKRKILFYHGPNGKRIEFTKTKDGWVADDGRKLEEITESRIRICPK